MKHEAVISARFSIELYNFQMDGPWFVLRMLLIRKYLVRNRPLRELDVKAPSIKLVFELDNMRVFLAKLISV